jgi:uncharacterized OB-fold protein
MTVPIPRPDPVSAAEAEFWSFLRAGELRLQVCASCGTFRHPPRPTCTACGSSDAAWRVAAGRGEVWTFTVIHPPTLPAFAAMTPYGAVVVRLDEGVFMVSRIIDCPNDELEIGARVELAVTTVEGDAVLPYFRRA